MSLNLHDIVRKAITYNYADGVFKLYRSKGQVNLKGLITASYAPAITIKGNFQSEADANLAHANLAGQNSITRKLYLYATSDREQRAWAIYRPLARSGDIIEDEHGGYWEVHAVEEDFSDAGWLALRCIYQSEPITLNIVEDDTDDGTSDNEPNP